MKALKIAGIVIGVLIVLVLLLGVIAPKEMKTARSIVINAPREKVFNTVNDLTTWEKWSPWKEMDPESVMTMGEKTEGVGAYYTWKGEKTGSGKMTIEESVLNERILVDVEFDGMGSAKAPFTFTRADNGIQVSWGFTAEMPYPMNAMMLFVDMEEQTGKDFEKGLSNLKNLIEMEEKNSSPKQTIVETDMPFPYVVGVRKTVKMSDVQQFYTENLGKVYSALMGKNITPAGQPCGVYFTWDDASQTSDMMAAIPVSEEVKLGGEFETVTLPKGKAVVLNYYGSYENMDRAHNIVDNYILLKKLEVEMPVMEEYVTDPTTVSDPNQILTRVIYPIK
ncbi:MAG: SRPBCC family protein [Saprospiraceae bacterium]|nr:SRPBCC family protein [Lewinella sp.]